MSSGGNGDSADEAQRASSSKLIKLFIALGACAALYAAFHEGLGNVFSGAQRSKIQGDWVEISQAITRYEMQTKKRFEEYDLDKLVGTSLNGQVRDPDGRPYIFDWFHRRLVYTGPDGVLQTTVPGKTAEPGENDDEVHPLAAFERLVYARPEGAGAAVELANSDGSGAKVLATSAAPVIDVKGLPARDSNLVVLTVGTAAGSQLATLDVSGETHEITAITKGEHHDGWPTLYSPTTEWIFYQSDADTGAADRTHLYKVSYKDRAPAMLTKGDGGFAEPGVESKARGVWYAARDAGGGTLWRFELSSFNQPQKKLAQAGRDLSCPAPSAAGDWIAYLATDVGKTTLEVADTRSGEKLFDTAEVVPGTAICWSPDDAKIGYLVKKSEGTQIALTHIAKKVTVVLPQIVSGRSFAWLHD